MIKGVETVELDARQYDVLWRNSGRNTGLDVIDRCNHRAKNQHEKNNQKAQQ